MVRGGSAMLPSLNRPRNDNVLLEGVIDWMHRPVREASPMGTGRTRHGHTR